ncbi:hypothetical protein Ddye_008745 [Dipteronia dyeriana]|uniref:Uncharacterized protein n=1 Tax=Dipteronia dyeriana TaxID=168575 RepID=A0AAE0CM76_9ROSI|nr:hypothetical protein Ddye_008745 [Dipteronia dyeriana]
MSCGENMIVDEEIPTVLPKVGVVAPSVQIVAQTTFDIVVSIENGSSSVGKEGAIVLDPNEAPCGLFTDGPKLSKPEEPTIGLSNLKVNFMKINPSKLVASKALPNKKWKLVARGANPPKPKTKLDIIARSTEIKDCPDNVVGTSRKREGEDHVAVSRTGSKESSSETKKIAERGCDSDPVKKKMAITSKTLETQFAKSTKKTDMERMTIGKADSGYEAS